MSGRWDALVWPKGTRHKDREKILLLLDGICWDFGYNENDDLPGDLQNNLIEFVHLCVSAGKRVVSFRPKGR